MFVACIAQHCSVFDVYNRREAQALVYDMRANRRLSLSPSLMARVERSCSAALVA
jgi:hypothetical protein